METTIDPGGDKTKFRLNGYTYLKVRKYKNYIKWKCLKRDGKYKCPGILHTNLNTNDANLKHQHNHNPKVKNEINCFGNGENVRNKNACQSTMRRDTPPRTCATRQRLRNTPMAGVVKERPLEEDFKRSMQIDQYFNRPNNNNYIPRSMTELSNSGIMWSAKKKTINVFFVLSDGRTDIENMSETMQLALQDCINHELITTVIDELDVCNMKSFQKGQVFVYDVFEGPAFKHVLSSVNKNVAVIVSPICLRICFIEGISIPENNSPIYTMAMRNVVLSVSNINPEEKERIKEKIEYMGGIFSYHLRDTTTHLMVGKVGSQKYSKAVETGITIMTAEWVDAVWEESIVRNIVSTDKKFDKYRCPPFYKLEITTSGLEVPDREKISTLVMENGGKFTPQMKKDVTNILILLKPLGQKFIYAQQWGLMCLKPSWIFDSVEKGYMLDIQDYVVRNTMLSSTPACPAVSNSRYIFSQNDISEIAPESKLIVDESIKNSDILKRQQINGCKSDEICTTPKKNNGQYDIKNINYKAILSDLSMSAVKKAGTILDGCKIYFSGFSLNEEERLKRIVISTGGIRYTELNESITHILVGNFSASLAKLLHSIQEKPHVVNLNWLLESINLKCTAPEEQFLAMDSSHSFTPESPSPLSKKGLYMMKNAILSQPKVVEKSKPSTSTIADIHPLDNFINQYLNVENTNSNGTQSQKSSCMSEDTMSTQDSKLELVLEGLTIVLCDLDSDQLSSIEKKIRAMGGAVVIARNYRGKIDYAIVPIVFNEKSLNIKATIVSCLWIEDCYNNVEEVPVEYFHKPVIFNSSTPLKNCVITVTNYAGSERYFLKELSLLLGAHYQDALSRKLKPKDNILATTHLICPTPEGTKYSASVKWGVPVVSKEWLLKCLIHKRRLPEDKFAIVNNGNKSLQECTVASFSNNVNESFTQNVTVPTFQENDLESELAIPLKDTEDDIEPPMKKKCSMEMKMSITQASREPKNKLTPVIAQLKSTCSTPVASTSFINNLKTPETPYGQIMLHNNPVSQETKKNWKKWLNRLPESSSESPQPSQLKDRRNSTPLSELKFQVLNKFFDPSNYKQEDTKQQSLDKQEFKRTMEELQQDLCMPREHEVPLRTESHSEDDHSKNSLFKERVIEPSQLCSVGWEDPTEQQEKARLKRLTECNKIFMLTSVKERQKYENAIEKLGACVLRSTMFSKDVTHVIMQQPSRSEKYLCSLASGKWILHPSYIDDCLNENCFLPEDKYEWGNPLSELSLPSPLHGAGYRWRSKICSDHFGAFSGMKVVLLTSEDRYQALKRLVQSGDGIILDKKDLLNSTHCFVDHGYGNIPASLNVIAAKGILLLSSLFLSDFLTKDPLPDPKLSLIPEYQAFYNRLAPNA